MRFERTHLLNATRFFQRTVDRRGRLRFLRGHTPLGALPLADDRPLELSFVDAGGSEWRFFNPSLARAPSSLARRCRVCVWVVALHASPLHQCDQHSPLLRAGRRHVGKYGAPLGKHTAIAVLGRHLQVIGWTWLLNEPSAQVASRPDSRGHQIGLEKWARFLSSPRPGRRTDASRLNNSGWFVPVGASGSGFAPPRLQQVFDVRLINAGGRLFASASCKGCALLLYSLHMEGTPSADGRSLEGLRAWAVQSFTTSATRHAWAQGRNQVHFALERRATGEEAEEGRGGEVSGEGERMPTLVAQVWLNVFGSWGAQPVPRSRTVVCHTATNETPPLRTLRPPDDDHGARAAAVAAGPRLCGATPEGERVRVEVLDEWASPAARQRRLARHVRRWQATGYPRYDSPVGPFGRLTLLANPSLPPGLVSVPGYAWSGQGKRLSLTANPILVRTASGCSAFLGVGHIHRGDGPLNRWFVRAAADNERRPHYNSSSQGSGRGRARARRHRAPRRRLRWTQPLQFGFAYSHFFYTFAPEPPFRLLATSAEFCLQAAAEPAGVCEQIQFASGLALEDGNRTAAAARAQDLLVTYGVNDCEARIGRLDLERLWPMLRPLPGEARACV